MEKNKTASGFITLRKDLLSYRMNFNSDRNFYHNFALGFGPRQSLGKYVGMAMIPEMVRQVVLGSELKSDTKISYRNSLFPDREGLFLENYPVS